MALMQISFSVLIARESLPELSPIIIIAKPIISEATIIYSIFAVTNGAIKFEGKMPTNVSIKLTGSLALKVKSVV